MKWKNSGFVVAVVVLACMVVSAAQAGTPLGTAFTYQGQLRQEGLPYTGSADLVLTLFDAQTGGTVIAGPVTISNVYAAGGLFAAAPDFGVDAFNGESRWLDVQVRTPSGSGVYTTLSPRQAVAAVPYALQTRGLFVNPSMNGVGVGTTDPRGLLHLKVGTTPSSEPFATNVPLRIESDIDTFVSLLTSDTAMRGILFGPRGNWSKAHIIYNGWRVPNGFQIDSNGVFAMAIDQSGRVGVGTTSPTQTLEVSGNVKIMATDPTNGSAGIYSHQAGTGTAGSFIIANPSSSNSAVYGQTGGTGAAVAGYQGGLGHAGAFTVDNSNNTMAAVYAATGGKGPAVYGYQSGLGEAGSFSIVNSANTLAAVAAYTTGSGPAIRATSGGTGPALEATGVIRSLWGGFKFPDGTVQTTAATGGPGYWTSNGSSIYNNNTGNVGIGTSNPTSKFHLLRAQGSDGATAATFEFTGAGASYVDFIRNSTTNGQTVRTFRIVGNNDYDSFTSFRIGMVTNHPLALVTNDAERIRVTADGNVGIGTTAPQAKLDIAGDMKFSGALSNTIASDGRLLLQAGEELHLNPYGESPVVVGAGSGGAAGLIVRANTTTNTLTILGGSDLAEPFNVAAPKDAAQKIEPGMVVVIDADNPGQLKLSGKAYDRSVAGVISGANNLKPGMVMKSEKQPHADGDHPVALTGRVWCWCDASAGAIEPGDRLTTSSTAGHAMKVKDNGKAAGAVIGKAMTRLATGRGLVLVLVQPQ